MHETWQSITQMMGVGVLNGMQLTLAQAPPQQLINSTRRGCRVWGEPMQRLVQNLVAFIPNLLAALAILLVGLLHCGDC